MGKRILAGIGVVLCSGLLVLQLPAQEREGLGERIGERIDRGLRQLGSELKQEWSEIRQSVERMGVQGRVYSRLRWDKAIDTSKLDIEMSNANTVVLQGTVATVAHKRKAIELAQDTVGVASVVDKLTVATPE